ncbi:unnamed protein product, partial [marine sediment metagenome]
MSRIDENTINFMDIEMIYTDFIKFMMDYVCYYLLISLSIIRDTSL